MDTKIIAKLEPRRTLNTSGATTLPANYQEKGEAIFMLTSGLVRRKALRNGENPGDIRFSGISMVSLITDTGDKEINRDAINFWKNHPDVRDEVRAEREPEYAETSERRLYSLTVIGEHKKARRQSSEGFHQASSIIYQMAPVQRKEILFFFNEDVRELDDTDVVNILLDPKTGKVADKTFVTEFLKRFNPNADDGNAAYVGMVTNLHKGVMYGRVEFKNNMYYIEGDLVGQTTDDAVQYFRNNPKVYTNLVKYIAQSGDEGAMKDKEVKTVIDTSEETAFIPALSLEALKDKANSYKIQGVQSFKKIDSLLKKVNEYELANDLELTML